MRTITNYFNLPEPMYRALSHDGYSSGNSDISATRLISPPRIVTLRKFHEDEIEEDATERIWSLLGTSTHYMLEKSAGIMSTVEKRLFMPISGVETEDGPLVWKVSAQPDVYEENTIFDYKITSLWSVLFGEKPDWSNQVNIQACLHRYNGDEVNQAFIIAIMRDWQVSKSKYEKDYPKSAVAKISIPLWTYEEQLAYIQKRVKLHQAAQIAYEKEGKMPSLCTDTERWLRGEQWAVKFQNVKTGIVNKNAYRKFDNKTDALQFMSDNKDIMPKGKIWAEVEHRPGTNMRCLSYCDVADKFCPFGMQLHKEQEEKIMAAQKKEEEVQKEDE